MSERELDQKWLEGWNYGAKMVASLPVEGASTIVDQLVTDLCLVRTVFRSLQNWINGCLLAYLFCAGMVGSP